MPLLVRLCTVCLSLSLLGCRVDSNAPVVVTFWAMGREGEVVQSLVPEFERRTPGVRIRVQQIPWNAAHEKLLTAYVGDAMPDVFQAGNTWIPEFVALDAIEPLDTRITQSSIVHAADYFPGILDTNVIDTSAGSGTYGVPWYVDTRLLFYRTDVLQQIGYSEPPATWDAWVEVLRRVKQQAGAERYAILLPITEWQTPVILALQLDALLLRDHDQYGNFRDTPFRRAFDFYLDLFRHGLAPRAGTSQIANLYQDFANGYFAFYLSGPWNIGEFTRRLPANLNDRWATAPLPGPDGAHPGVSIAGGASLAVLRTSPHKDAAWKWIEFLSATSQQVAFYRLTGDLPARPSAWEDPALADNRYAQAFRRQLEHVRSTPKIPEWERIAHAISQSAEAVIRGTTSTDAALTALDAEVDAILEKRRWLLQRSGRALESTEARREP
jgi:multiple sugar transport system substrate-binding protein